MKVLPCSSLWIGFLFAGILFESQAANPGSNPYLDPIMESSSFSVFHNEPLSVGSVANIRQEITLSTDLPTGSGLLIAKHWLNSSEFQTTNRQGANYVRLSSDRDQVNFTPQLVNRKGIFGGLDIEIGLPLFTISQGELFVGDKVTIEYLNLELPLRATESFQLPVYYQLDAAGEFFPMSSEKLQINAGKVNRVKVIVPSLIPLGIPFEMKVLLQDEFDNAATGRAPSFDVLVDGSFHSRIPAGDLKLHRVKNIQFDSEQSHRIEVRSSGGGISGLANPFQVTRRTDIVLWGETRKHTRLGDGLGSPFELNPELDFEITAIHGRYLNDELWQSLPGPKAWIWDKSLKKGGSHMAITQQEYVELPNQSSLVRHMLPGSATMVALPMTPIDDRFLDDKVHRLVELVSNASHFERYANTLLSRGYRLGFTASEHSHLPRQEVTTKTALTAIITKSQESWMDALHRGSTYVTTGERILLNVTVNGAGPGARIKAAKRRLIKGSVIGTGPIDRVDLIKNGKLFKSSNNAHDATSSTIKITFYSDSGAFQQQRDLPRNGREWLGYFKSTGAEIAAINPVSFRDARQRGIAMNPNEKNRVDFITWTHGTWSSFLIDLVIQDDSAVLELNLRDGHEDIDTFPNSRAASPIGSVRQMISLFDIQQGAVQRIVKVAGYADEITFELVNPQASNEVEFEFTDSTQSREGDYYYIRVHQLDDEMAWSSPVFVGGFDHP